METLISIGLLQLVAVISPGPSFLITARTAVAHSRWDGVKVALGLGAGIFIWPGAALLGLQALFQQFDWLYFGMKIFGVLFILWIAYQVIRHAAEPLALDDVDGTNTIRPFTQGFMTQISNPKVVVFFASISMALMPSEMPLWMAFALIAIVSFNEIC
jgi:threonine/homoserine/homoserine lactone efflux protein